MEEINYKEIKRDRKMHTSASLLAVGVYVVLIMAPVACAYNIMSDGLRARDKKSRAINANRKSYDALLEKKKAAEKELNDSLSIWTQMVK
ncbi:MAG: hypothetical protein LBJ73_00960 [Rickettsiales bacterium]|jgi:hypothetical protein|nr:hypothetical protein [Rickettsiales bacterium]